MELRDIEIFLTLAEELHFARTAERLHITPARVSQSIKQQERRIGGALFTRTTRQVALTPIGRQLYEELRLHHRGLHDSLERATRAARGDSGTLRLGMIASNLDDVRPLLEKFRALRPDCPLEITHQHFSDPFGALRRDEIDLQITWLPVAEPDLTIGPEVYAERIVLAVAADHPFAGRSEVCWEDLADQLVPNNATTADYWVSSVVPHRTPSGRPIVRGPVATNFQELITVVAAGHAICPVHEHARRYYSRPDIRYVPIVDAPLSHWAVIWRTNAESPLVRAFARIVEENGPLDL